MLFFPIYEPWKIEQVAYFLHRDARSLFATHRHEVSVGDVQIRVLSLSAGPVHEVWSGVVSNRSEQVDADGGRVWLQDTDWNFLPGQPHTQVSHQNAERTRNYPRFLTTVLCWLCQVMNTAVRGADCVQMHDMLVATDTFKASVTSPCRKKLLVNM